jgi:hypothetical protein
MPTKAELEAEVTRLAEALAQFTDPEHARLVSFVDGQWSFKSPIFPIFVNTAAQMLAEVNAKNYIEMRAAHPDVGPIVVTVQKEWGKTPADLRTEAEEEVERLRSIIGGIEYAVSEGKLGELYDLFEQVNPTSAAAHSTTNLPSPTKKEPTE